jgi:hypothetical protein
MIWQARNFVRAVVRTNLIITKTFLEAVIDRLEPLSPAESNSPNPDEESPPEQPPEEAAPTERKASRPRASRRRRKPKSE